MLPPVALVIISECVPPIVEQVGAAVAATGCNGIAGTAVGREHGHDADMDVDAGVPVTNNTVGAWETNNTFNIFILNTDKIN